MSDGHLGELLSAYLDGEATRSEEERIVLHLDGCEHCRGELLDLDAARSAVRSLPVLEPAHALSPSAATREQPAIVPTASLAEARRTRRLARPAAWVAAAAAALVLAVGGVGVMRGGSGGAEIDMAEMMDQHAVRVSVDPGLPAVQIVQVMQP